MKKIILILGFTVFLLGSCSHVVYAGLPNQPEYATKEYLSKKYHSLITNVDELILNSTSAFHLAYKLETLNYPSNIYFVSLERENDNELVIIDNSSSPSTIISINGFGYGNIGIEKIIDNSSSPSTIISINGFGYGNIGIQEIVLISRSVNKHGIDNLKLVLTHDE